MFFKHICSVVFIYLFVFIFLSAWSTVNHAIFYTINHAISYFLHNTEEVSSCGIFVYIDTVRQTVKVKIHSFRYIQNVTYWTKLQKGQFFKTLVTEGLSFWKDFTESFLFWNWKSFYLTVTSNTGQIKQIHSPAAYKSSCIILGIVYWKG